MGECDRIVTGCLESVSSLSVGRQVERGRSAEAAFVSDKKSAGGSKMPKTRREKAPKNGFKKTKN